MANYFLPSHPVIRTLVPSPNQLLLREAWPGTETKPGLPLPTEDSSTFELNPTQQTQPEYTAYDLGYPQVHGGPPRPYPGINQFIDHQQQPQRRRRPQHPTSGPGSYAPIHETRIRPPPRPPLLERIREKLRPEEETNYPERNTFPERSYDVLEAILFCIHDAQLFLAIALGLSFYLGTNCSMSQYHLDIAMNLSLIGCISFLLAFTLVRNYWVSPISSFIRIGCFVAVLVFLLLTSITQLNSGLVPEYEPPTARNDSLILLDAACFSNKTYQNELDQISESQRAIVGTTGRSPPLLSYYRLLWAIAIASGVSGSIRIYQFLFYTTNGPARKSRTTDNEEGIGFQSILLMIWWGVAWAACAVIYGATVHHVFKIRSWISGSGWVQPDEFASNPENDGRSFGQIAAIVATGSIVIAAFDRWKPKWWKTWLDDEE